VSGDRARGATLYLLAAIVLVAGGVWFFAAAPATGAHPALVAGREIAEGLLPDLPLQVEAETMVLAAGVRQERSTPVPGGSYALEVLCVGDGQVRVWLSATGAESGRAVRCAEANPEPIVLTMGLADEFFMAASAETDGPAVFRWRFTRAPDY